MTSSNNNSNDGATTTTITKFSGIENQKQQQQQPEHPTVLSQSFHLFPASTYYNIQFWDTLIQQHQQQLAETTDHTTFAKPIGGSSPDLYHESNHPAVLPIGGPRMAIDDLITGPTAQGQFMLFNHLQLNNTPIITHHGSMFIKDDVFLAQPSTLSRDVLSTSIVDHDDTASLSSHSSLSSSQHSDKLTISPCLSPVTSPTNFLYNHEPLFEGGIMEDLGSENGKRKISSSVETATSTTITTASEYQEYDDEEYDDLSSVLTDSTTSEDNNSSKQQQMMATRRLSTVSDDLDWFKLLDAFRADVACDLPETTTISDDHHHQVISDSSSSTDNEEDDSSSNGSSSSEDDDYEFIQAPLQQKRKRARSEETPVFGMYELNLSDDVNNQEPKRLSCLKNALQQTNRSSSQQQKRRRKTATMTPLNNNTKGKKYQQKKKKNHDTSMMMNPTIKLPAITSIATTINNKKDNNKKDEDQNNNKNNESSEIRCQLTESVTIDSVYHQKTMFQHLTEASIDWCRYCGTTEGVNWRPGPWGKRTLCNKHGCDYKGYGLASRLPRLDLSAFVNEKIQERLRPVVQQFCIVCQSPEEKEHHLIICSGGCSRAYHQQCHTPVIAVNPDTDPVRWYCSTLCKENRKRSKVVVELPRKHQPLMHLLPKQSKKLSSSSA